MTKVSYIHGIPKSEWQDRGANVPAPSFLDFHNMTEGELKLNLLREQLSILNGFYPEVEQYREGEQVLSDTLKDGLHKKTFAISGTGPVRQYVNKAIAEVRQMGQPAAKMWRKQTAIGDPIIDIDNCDQYAIIEEDEFGRYLSNPVEYNECLKQNEYKKILNSKLEDSAHHILYTFVSNPNLQPATVAAKTVNHRGVVALWHDITGISTDNLQLWIRNGVMRSNAKKGAEPLQPELTIDVLKEGSSTSVGIAPALLAALPAIISAIAAAVSATALLISSLQNKDRLKFESSFDGIGLPPFGPEQMDWQLGGGVVAPGGNGQGNDNTLLYLALAAGALYFIR